MQEYLDSLPTELLVAIAVQNVNTWSWLPVESGWCDGVIKQEIVDHYQTLTNLQTALGSQLTRQHEAFLEVSENDRKAKAKVKTERKRQYDAYQVGDVVTTSCNRSGRTEQRMILDKTEDQHSTWGDEQPYEPIRHLVLGNATTVDNRVNFGSLSPFVVEWEGFDRTTKKTWTIYQQV